MTRPAPGTGYLQEIQRNCDISDARDHGIYSMCTMVLKLRNLYKWEQGMEPWQEPDSAELLEWIDAREHYWATLATEEYRPVPLAGRLLPPMEVEAINEGLGEGLFYGAGFGRSLKTVFYVAEKREERLVDGRQVILLGRELAREMASPFAMATEGLVIIRTEPLRYFFWDQIQEMGRSCRSSWRKALETYGVLRDTTPDPARLRDRLDRMVEGELDLFIYHEVGETLATPLSTATLQTIIGHFPGSVMEFVSRAVKDLLADCHPSGLLNYLVREQRLSSLGFYLTFMDGLRQKLFPEIQAAWQELENDGEWRHIDMARERCWQRSVETADRITAVAAMIGEGEEEQCLARFRQEVLPPLGLE